MQTIISYPARRIIQNQEWLGVAALSLLVILLRLPSLEQPFDNDSGANAYHARLILRGEPLYGSHHPAHHMPAVYYTYALAFFLFGDSVWAVKFLLILWTIVAVCLLYHLGALLMDRATGLLAAVFYTILTSHIWMWGTSAQIELFANLPRIAALLALVRLMKSHAGAQNFILVGMLSAFTFLFKAVYLSPLVMAGFVLLAELRQARSTVGARRATVTRGLWIGVGFVAGLLPVVAYWGKSGLLPRFLMVFTLGQKYLHSANIASNGPEYWLIYPLFGLAISNAVLLTLSLAALLIMGLNKTWRSPLASYAAVWYIVSIVEAGTNRNLFTLHYYLLIVPPLALLTAWFLLKIYRDAKVRLRPANRFVAVLLLILLLTSSLFISIKQNLNYYNHYARYKLGLETYQDFLINGWPIEGQHLVRVQELADYVKEHTSPADYIYYWSGDMQIYYLADRRCPIDIIWPLYAEATGSYQRIFGPQTKYVLLGKNNIELWPDWLYTELAEKYVLETVINDEEIYRRVD